MGIDNVSHKLFETLFIQWGLVNRIRITRLNPLNPRSKNHKLMIVSAPGIIFIWGGGLVTQNWYKIWIDFVGITRPPAFIEKYINDVTQVCFFLGLLIIVIL
jgi:hypothetical protein